MKKYHSTILIVDDDPPDLYWMTCEVPEVDRTGRQLPTDSEGKLGERFAQA